LFYCGYCHKKTDSLGRVDGYEAKTAEGWQALPSCPKCAKHNKKCGAPNMHLIPMRKRGKK